MPATKIHGLIYRCAKVMHPRLFLPRFSYNRCARLCLRLPFTCAKVMHPRLLEKVLCKAYSLRYLVAQMMRLVALRCITRDLCVCSTAGRISQRRLFSAAQDLLASRLDFLCGGLPSSLPRSPRQGQDITCAYRLRESSSLRALVASRQNFARSSRILHSSVLHSVALTCLYNKLVIVCVCYVYVYGLLGY